MTTVEHVARPCGDCPDVHEFGSTSRGVSDKAWDGSASRFTDEQYKMSCAACDDGEESVRQRCFLPHHEPGGAINPNGVHAAAGRVSSLKGKSPEAISRAKAHLRSHYKALGEEAPDSIAASAGPQTDVAPPGGSTNETEGEVGLVAADGPVDVTGLPTRWHGYAMVEGLRSGRYLVRAGATLWRDIPLTIEWQPEGSDHSKPFIVGGIDTAEDPIVRAGYQLLPCGGTFDLEGEMGREAARQCRDKRLRWISAVTEVFTSEERSGSTDGGFGDPLLDELFGMSDDWYTEVISQRIVSLAMVTIPNWPQCVIAPEGEELPEVEPMGNIPEAAPVLIAAAAEAGIDLEAPPRGWFEDPHFPCYTPMTVTREGKVMFHLAPWGVEHTSYPGRKVYAPHSVSNYAYAMTGRRRCDDGTLIPTGPITLGTGHADTDPAVSYHAAAAHYDNTGVAVADVVYGEDQFGIWASGALRPGVTSEQIGVMLASAPSGDWRSIRGDLDLIATLMVNHPGFPPIPGSLQASALWKATAHENGPRAGFTHDGEQKTMVSLVAAGIVPRDQTGALSRRLLSLEAQVASLRHVIEPALTASIDALRARVFPNGEVE